MDEIMQKIASIAKENLENDGYLTAMAFILKKGQFVPMQIKFETDEEKYRSSMQSNQKISPYLP